jgi:hypothetical protein
MRRVVERAQPRGDEPVRQLRLVDDPDRGSVGFQPDRTRGFSVDFHGPVF